MPKIQTIPTNYAVGDYCHMLQRGEVQINRDYQRSDKVWPLAAKSFFVESIVLGYPVPKICLHQKIDVKTRRSIKHVVDGQQRSMALLEFFLTRSVSRRVSRQRVLRERNIRLSMKMINGNFWSTRSRRICSFQLQMQISVRFSGE